MRRCAKQLLFALLHALACTPSESKVAPNDAGSVHGPRCPEFEILNQIELPDEHRATVLVPLGDDRALVATEKSYYLADADGLAPVGALNAQLAIRKLGHQSAWQADDGTIWIGGHLGQLSKIVPVGGSFTSTVVLEERPGEFEMVVTMSGGRLPDGRIELVAMTSGFDFLVYREGGDWTKHAITTENHQRVAWLGPGEALATVERPYFWRYRNGRLTEETLSGTELEVSAVTHHPNVGSILGWLGIPETGVSQNQGAGWRVLDGAGLTGGISEVAYAGGEEIAVGSFDGMLTIYPSPRDCPVARLTNGAPRLIRRIRDGRMLLTDRPRNLRTDPGSVVWFSWTFTDEE